jgi:hypothetical protein
MIFAYQHCTMSNHVIRVLTRCSPVQIISVIIQTVTVFMGCYVMDCRRRTMKHSTNETINPMLNSVDAANFITTVIDSGF